MADTPLLSVVVPCFNEQDNLGPLVTLWGSLATLLWRERCKARGVEVSARHFAAMGLLGVPIVLVASTIALSLT